MQTPRNEKGLSAANAQTHMQTEADFHATAPQVQRPLSPRQDRALSALLSGPQTAQQIGRAAGCNNPPDLISNLRSRIGLVIPCTFSRVMDRDGRSVERGTYRLTGADRDKAEEFLQALAHAGRATA